MQNASPGHCVCSPLSSMALAWKPSGGGMPIGPSSFGGSVIVVGLVWVGGLLFIAEEPWFIGFVCGAAELLACDVSCPPIPAVPPEGAAGMFVVVSPGAETVLCGAPLPGDLSSLELPPQPASPSSAPATTITRRMTAFLQSPLQKAR